MKMGSAMSDTLDKCWSRGDSNGFLGFFANILTNIMVFIGVLYSVGLPADIVIGRIIPGVGISIAAGNFYYAHMARKIAKKEGREDVTALPYGPSTAHLFFVSYLVIGPVSQATGDPILAWQAGLAWCVLESVIEVAGAFAARRIRNATPRAAMLGNLAGIALTVIVMKPLSQIWSLPLIGLVCFGIALAGFFSNKRLPFGIPAAGWMVLFGIFIGWATGTMRLDNLQDQLGNMKFAMPILSITEIVNGFRVIAPYLISVIPFGITNAIGTLNNVESAETAGDSFNIKETMVVDGVGSFCGALFGCPCPTTVYTGHPGYKNMGARSSYSVATGIATLIVCFFGLVPVFLAIIPIYALLPILVYIGLVIGARAFQASPKQHAPAIIVAMIPWLASWVISIIDNTLKVAGTSAWAEGMILRLQSADIYYLGFLSLSRGSILTSMALATMTVFLIDGKLKNASITSAALAALAFFGFIHSPNIGINMAPYETIGYILIAVITFFVYFYNNRVKKILICNDIIEKSIR